ncbi:MAG TPA: cation diffusion facilitator family transporter [Nocardioides sp.]|jgi:cation diffusion facilitator family transporter|nr:cation diffusion facilitator family transporter [Nocardioides sp.]
MSGSEADEQTDAGAGETTTTVVIAFFANLAIAVAKTIVALATGSASMLAESAHSWADTGNQVLLFIADRRSRKPPDDGHPLGYGREAYVWSLVAAFGLFTAGAVVSVWEGVSKLLAEETGEVSYTWAYVVLGLAFVFEGVSFAQAFRQTRREARPLDRHVLEHAFETSDPTLRAVFAEDAAALLGLLVAAVGVFLHQVTGNPVYDAMGSIVVGLLLGVVAVVLINQNRRFLTGQESDPELRRVAIDRVKALPGVARVTYLRLEYVGPRQVFLTARVDLEGEPRETTIAQVLRDLEERLTHERYVRAAVLSLATPDEPDL